MDKTAFERCKWIQRGEYLIGINESGREIGLIKLFPEAFIPPSTEQTKVHKNKGRVSM